MVEQYIRWDFIGLSTDNKPTSENEKVTDGSTYYESDTSKYYVYYKGTWYEKQDTGGGGTTIELYKTVGQNEDGAMTQKATTDMIFGDGGTGYKIRIGSDATDAGDNGIAIGHSASSGASESIAIGHSAYIGTDNSEGIVIGHGSSISGYNNKSIVIGRGGSIGNSSRAIVIGDSGESMSSDTIVIGSSAKCYSGNSYSVTIGPSASAKADSVALGAYSKPTVKGEVNIGTRNSGSPKGYNNTHYRIITDVHDGIDNHCAATVAQGNTLATSAPTSSTEGVLGQLYTDTTNMHTYQCTAIDTTDPANPSYTWTQRW